MDIFLFIIFATVYIMVMHFAVGIKKEFNVFLMITMFVISGVVGYVMNSLEFGVVLGIILTLIFI